MGELGDHRAAHRVADEGRRLDAPVVEEARGGVSQVRDVQRLGRVPTAAEARQVGDERVVLLGQALGRRDEVGPGHPEAVQVEHHRSVHWTGRLAVEDLDAVERRPALGEP
jgi:hypothetical protein